MMLLSVVVAAAFGVVVVDAARSRCSRPNRFTAEGEAQTIADRITKDLRTAVTTSATGAAFASADVNDVTFYANLADPNGPDQAARVPHAPAGHERLPVPRGRDAARCRRQPRQLHVHRHAASTRIDGKYLDTSQPIFSYYDAQRERRSPTPITTAPTCAASTASASTSASACTPTAPIVVINTLVHVRNVDYNPNT